MIEYEKNERIAADNVYEKSSEEEREKVTLIDTVTKKARKRNIALIY